MTFEAFSIMIGSSKRLSRISESLGNDKRTATGCHDSSATIKDCVARYKGDRRLRGFSCWGQLLCMGFAQFTYRESLRDIEACLRSSPDKLYHMGIRGRVSRSTLAEANENHDWHIFADFAQVLIARARVLCAPDSFGAELQHSADAMDSTTIDLCLTVFPWARFRERNSAVKMHTLIDLHGNIPLSICVTDRKVHDVNCFKASRILHEKILASSHYSNSLFLIAGALRRRSSTPRARPPS